MNITRRTALESDTDYCRDVHHRAYRDVCERQFGPWDEVIQDGFFNNEWDALSFEIVLDDGVPCGYLRVDVGTQHVQVHELVVDPSFQNRGIGSFLLREIMKQARALSLPVRLGTLHQNRAMALYRRMGFEETGWTETHTLLELSVPK